MSEKETFGPLGLAERDFFALNKHYDKLYEKMKEREGLLSEEEFFMYRMWIKLMLNSIY